MKIIVNIFISLFLGCWALINWFFQMKITDYPAFFTLGELFIYFILVLLFVLANLLYMRKTKLNVLTLVLYTPTIILWMLTLVPTLTNDGGCKYDPIGAAVGVIALIGVYVYGCFMQFNHKIIATD
ncbi:hypothetical protein [Clostridium sp.]|uniref:hypothetical protein n=1 Tax=Clostridium sp. TaxID=1506 RepID=UPI002FC87F59